MEYKFRNIITDNEGEFCPYGGMASEDVEGMLRPSGRRAEDVTAAEIQNAIIHALLLTQQLNIATRQTVPVRAEINSSPIPATSATCEGAGSPPSSTPLSAGLAPAS